MTEFKVGDIVNYHSIIGQPPSRTDLEITHIAEMCGTKVAYTKQPGGCLDLEHLTHA